MAPGGINLLTVHITGTMVESAVDQVILMYLYLTAWLNFSEHVIRRPGLCVFKSTEADALLAAEVCGVCPLKTRTTFSSSVAWAGAAKSRYFWLGLEL